MNINKEILLTIVKNSGGRLEGEQEILEINEQQLHIISKKLTELFSLYGVVKSLKDKKVITFEDYKRFIYKKEYHKYYNKETQMVMDEEEIELRYNYHLQNL